MISVLSHRKTRHTVLFLIDLFCLALALVLIFGIYPSSAMQLSTRLRVIHSLMLTGCVFFFRIILRVYAQSWRYANESAYMLLVITDSLGCAVYYGVSSFFMVYKISAIHTLAVVALELLLTLSCRFLYQLMRGQEHPVRRRKKRLSADKTPAIVKTRVAIVGASDTGVLLAQELMKNKASLYHPVCFFDNNPLKIGSYIVGLKVYPENEDIAQAVLKLSIGAFIIAIPEKDTVYIKELFERYKLSGRRVLIYDSPLNPRLDADGKRTIREINIEDLMLRDKVDFDGTQERAFYKGKTILVTGAGGSIGSELCRQLCYMNPGRLVLLDNYENSVYDLQMELAHTHGGSINISIEIASITDDSRINAVFSLYHPDFVFHAAAHKHVPLMEHCPEEAIKNNVFGTLNVVNAAQKHGVKRFIMISTDKAVNPTNIMGASKRLCEMIIKSRKDCATDFVAVRFGNVLNSNGSVIPLFKRQILEGGPVTVTDKRIIRYFMMIPEAAQLVLQTGCLAEKGDIYVLDMGKPVKILDLAENIIRLSGLEPYRDIDIVEVGLRPGEKLYEELLVQEETTRGTEKRRIFIDHEPGLSEDEVAQKLMLLRRAMDQSCEETLRETIRQVVPTYRSADEINRDAMNAMEMKDAALNCRAPKPQEESI